MPIVLEKVYVLNFFLTIPLGAIHISAFDDKGTGITQAKSIISKLYWQIKVCNIETGYKMVVWCMTAFLQDSFFKKVNL